MTLRIPFFNPLSLSPGRDCYVCACGILRDDIEDSLFPSTVTFALRWGESFLPSRCIQLRSTLREAESEYFVHIPPLPPSSMLLPVRASMPTTHQATCVIFSEPWGALVTGTQPRSSQTKVWPTLKLGERGSDEPTRAIFDHTCGPLALFLPSTVPGPPC